MPAREPWSDREADHAQDAVDLVAAPEGASVVGNHHTIMIDECPNCHGEGRSLGATSKWGDGSPTDYGPCQVCGGSGELEQEFECRTLDDLETEAASPAVERAMTHFHKVSDELMTERCKTLEVALMKLANECDAMRAFEHEIRAVAGNTNWNVLRLRVDEARMALKTS